MVIGGYAEPKSGQNIAVNGRVEHSERRIRELSTWLLARAVAPVVSGAP
jgi:hypothetical protein